MLNWLKSLFGKSEERSVQVESKREPLMVSLEKYHQFRNWLKTQVRNGNLKDYKCIRTFLDEDQSEFIAFDGEFPLEAEFDIPTEPMREFLDNFGFLNCKTSDEKFAAYVQKYSKYAK
jgi:hypothetical protein